MSTSVNQDKQNPNDLPVTAIPVTPDVRVSGTPVPPPPKKTNAFGYPIPAPQIFHPAAATATHFFISDKQWDEILKHGEFDDIIVGSGFCALAYVTEALERDPYRKILILERGGFWLADHYQNLPLPYRVILGESTVSFPWQLSSKTYQSELKLVAGFTPFFGGRSPFWSGWCPEPTRNYMRGWPESMLKTTEEPIFWEKARRLLHVTRADKIQDGVFSTLQTKIDHILQKNISQILSSRSAEPAPLAVGRRTPTSRLLFNKFAVQGPLLTLHNKQNQLANTGKGSPLLIATDVTVERFFADEENNNAVKVLKTSRGNLCFPKGKTNIILANSAIPAATVILNSLESMKARAGHRLSGQILGQTIARFPIDQERFPDLGRCTKGDACDGDCGYNLQMTANYIAGMDDATQLQYHIQVSAIYSPHPKWDIVDAARESTDYAASVTPEQLEGSEDHLILVCTSLGEYNEQNPEAWVKYNPQDRNPITNVKVQATMDPKTKSLQKVMDQATFDAIAVMAGPQSRELEYWHHEGGWSNVKPTPEEVCMPGLIHDASTLYMGPESDPHAAIDQNYAVYGCKNVYVTGAAIFPSAGMLHGSMVKGETDATLRIVESNLYHGCICPRSRKKNCPSFNEVAAVTW
uniref:Glucose-methanol-choline oxidoreductase C-terminal domain-containing protein n=1 Tax=Psilocybe cubensis TaxID=181762 RepID=A0A8H8CJZ7_PSICU